MANKRLAIASVLLVALVGVTVVTMNKREEDVKAPAATTVELPKVDTDAVDTLEVAAPKKPKVKLVKGADGWRVAEPVDAAADQKVVQAAVDKLAELEVTGVAATNDKNYELLEVTPEKAAHVVAKKGDEVLADLYVGRYRSGSTMVRKEGDVPVVSVKGSIRYAFMKEVREWRDREVAKVEADQVTELELVNKKGSFRFVKEGDEWKQAPGEKAIEDFDGSKVGSIVGSAASLRAVDFADEDVTAEEAEVGPDAKRTATLTVAGGDAGVGEQIVYRIGRKKSGNYYLMRDGNDTIYLVSSWIADRLTSGVDGFQKKAEAEAPKAPNVVEAKPIPRPNDLVPVGKIKGAGASPH